MCYVRSLFEKVDALRIKLSLTIDEVIPFVGVTSLTYKNWRKGSVPHAWREDNLRQVCEALTALDICKPKPPQRLLWLRKKLDSLKDE